jgi:hypothetical protein
MKKSRIDIVLRRRFSASFLKFREIPRTILGLAGWLQPLFELNLPDECPR